ncbi:adenylate cyclase [Chitinimonas arctica]|nr:adenylate cyclase [Chitinimonas arctica]
MALQDERAIHARRAKLILLVGSSGMLVAGLIWAVYFASQENWPVVGMDFALICAGALSLRMVRAGKTAQSTLLMNASVFGILVFMALFLDLPSDAAPRTVQLYLIPLALSTNLLLRGERPWLRHGPPVLSLLTVVILSSSNFGVLTSMALPDSVRIGGGWFNCGLAMGILYLLIVVFFGDIDRIETQLQRAHNCFVELIGSMFPRSIAERLLSTGQAFAERHSNCSILFADIVGFTPLAAKLAPEDLVKLLSGIFVRFDQCVEQYGLTKIKTIGDTYMVAAGIPDPDGQHARKIVEFGQKMLEIVQSLDGVDLRIGIASGEVVAGVIGQSRQIYDVWGDVVNMASRMESQGLSGHIQVSQETFELTRQWFNFEARGEVAIKGKAEMQKTYLLAKASQSLPEWV